jgi:hypothetical protein
MSTTRFRLPEGDRQVSEEPAAGGDPLALDPFSPITLTPGSGALSSPLALDPLSPIRRDAA